MIARAHVLSPLKLGRESKHLQTRSHLWENWTELLKFSFINKTRHVISSDNKNFRSDIFLGILKNARLRNFPSFSLFRGAWQMAMRQRLIIPRWAKCFVLLDGWTFCCSVLGCRHCIYLLTPWPCQPTTESTSLEFHSQGEPGVDPSLNQGYPRS